MPHVTFLCIRPPSPMILEVCRCLCLTGSCWKIKQWISTRLRFVIKTNLLLGTVHSALPQEYKHHYGDMWIFRETKIQNPSWFFLEKESLLKKYLSSTASLLASLRMCIYKNWIASLRFSHLCTWLKFFVLTKGTHIKMYMFVHIEMYIWANTTNIFNLLSWERCDCVRVFLFEILGDKFLMAHDRTPYRLPHRWELVFTGAAVFDSFYTIF